jgi:transposase
MANRKSFIDERRQRQNRYFSESFKRERVSDYEKNLVNIAELSREYQVSRTAVYKWIYKYSAQYQRQEKQVVEKKSDTRKIKALEEKVKELERIVGQKQIQVDFYTKMIAIAEEKYKIDIKKKSSTPRSNGSGSSGNSTRTSSTKSTKV